MNESHTAQTAETMGSAALPVTTRGTPLSDRLLALAVIGGGALATFLWVAVLVYALIVVLF